MDRRTIVNWILLLFVYAGKGANFDCTGSVNHSLQILFLFSFALEKLVTVSRSLMKNTFRSDFSHWKETETVEVVVLCVFLPGSLRMGFSTPCSFYWKFSDKLLFVRRFISTSFGDSGIFISKIIIVRKVQMQNYYSTLLWQEILYIIPYS